MTKLILLFLCCMAVPAQAAITDLTIISISDHGDNTIDVFDGTQGLLYGDIQIRIRMLATVNPILTDTYQVFYKTGLDRPAPSDTKVSLQMELATPWVNALTPVYFQATLPAEILPPIDYVNFVIAENNNLDALDNVGGDSGDGVSGLGFRFIVDGVPARVESMVLTNVDVFPNSNTHFASGQSVVVTVGVDDGIGHVTSTRIKADLSSLTGNQSDTAVLPTTFIPPTATWVVPVTNHLTDSAAKVTISVYDWLGNGPTVAESSIIADNTPPTIDSIQIANSTVSGVINFAKEGDVIEVSANVNGSGKRELITLNLPPQLVLADNNPVSDPDANGFVRWNLMTVSGTQDNSVQTLTLEIRANDEVENQLVETFILVVDNKAPTINNVTIQNGLGNVNTLRNGDNNVAVIADITDDSGIDPDQVFADLSSIGGGGHVRYSRKDEDDENVYIWDGNAMPIVTNGITGTPTIEISCSDIVRNGPAKATDSIILDDTPPTSTLPRIVNRTINREDVFKDGDKLDISIDVADNISLVGGFITADIAPITGLPGDNSVAPTSFNGVTAAWGQVVADHSGDEEKTIIIKVQDDAGNTTYVETTILADNTPPEIVQQLTNALYLSTNPDGSSAGDMVFKTGDPLVVDASFTESFLEVWGNFSTVDSALEAVSAIHNGTDGNDNDQDAIIDEEDEQGVYTANTLVHSETVQSPDGLKTISVEGFDLARNSTVGVLVVTLDNTAPIAKSTSSHDVVQKNDDDNRYHPGQNVRILVLAQAEEEGLTGSLRITRLGGDPLVSPVLGLPLSSSGGGAYYYDWNTTGERGGTDYRVEVVLVDVAGNIDSDGSNNDDYDLAITLDDDPPVVVIDTIDRQVPEHDNEQYFIGTQVRVLVTDLGQDLELTGTISIDYVGGTIAAPVVELPLIHLGGGVYYYDWSTSPEAEGYYTLQATLNDSSTVVSSEVLNLWLDNTPPDILELDTRDHYDSTDNDELYHPGQLIRVTTRENYDIPTYQASVRISSNKSHYNSGILLAAFNPRTSLYTYLWDTEGLSIADDYMLTFKLKDEAYNADSTNINVELTDESPHISFLRPVAGARLLGNDIRIEAATDSTNLVPLVAVDFYYKRSSAPDTLDVWRHIGQDQIAVDGWTANWDASEIVTTVETAYTIRAVAVNESLNQLNVDREVILVTNDPNDGRSTFAGLNPLHNQSLAIGRTVVMITAETFTSEYTVIIEVLDTDDLDQVPSLLLTEEENLNTVPVARRLTILMDSSQIYGDTNGDGLQDQPFPRSILLQVPYTEDASTRYEEEYLRLYYHDPLSNSWVTVEDSELITSNNLIESGVFYAGIYRLMEFMPDISGAPLTEVYCYPNPAPLRAKFGNRVYFRYILNENATVSVEIYNIAGEYITTIYSSAAASQGGYRNRHVIPWELGGVASGVYIARLVAKTASHRKYEKFIKVMVVK